MPPPFGYPRPNSDSEFDSETESRRHRGRRESSSRHRYVVDHDEGLTCQLVNESRLSAGHAGGMMATIWLLNIINLLCE